MDKHSSERYFRNLDKAAGDKVEAYRKEHFPKYPHIGGYYDPFDKGVRKLIYKLLEKGLAGYSFAPFLSSTQTSRKYYKRSDDVPSGYKWKNRPISNAAHRDKLIFAIWSDKLSHAHKRWLTREGLTDHVVAYVPEVGRSNIEAAKFAFDWLHDQEDWQVACMDVTGFFDNLDHGYLKARLQDLLKVDELSDIDYKLFRAVTAYSKIKRVKLKKRKDLGLAPGQELTYPVPHERKMLERLAKLRLIRPNEKGKGTPQGLPCSGVLSNIYMMDFDLQMVAAAKAVNGLYMRYADDLFLAAPTQDAVDSLQTLVQQLFSNDLKLEAKEDKTDLFSKNGSVASRVSYLGIDYQDGKIFLRESSVLRYYRRMRRYAMSYVSTVRKRHYGYPSIGILHARFGHNGSRNFYSYARRVKNVFDSDPRHRYNITGIFQRLKGHQAEIIDAYNSANQAVDRIEDRRS